MDILSICAKHPEAALEGREFYQDISATRFSSESKTSINGYNIILISPQKRQITQENVLALAVFVKSILYFKDFLLLHSITFPNQMSPDMLSMLIERSMWEIR